MGSLVIGFALWSKFSRPEKLPANLIMDQFKMRSWLVIFRSKYFVAILVFMILADSGKLFHCCRCTLSKTWEMQPMKTSWLGIITKLKRPYAWCLTFAMEIYKWNRTYILETTVKTYCHILIHQHCCLVPYQPQLDLCIQMAGLLRYMSIFLWNRYSCVCKMWSQQWNS